MANASKRSILIIEDDQNSRETLNDLLSNEYNTHLAANGEEGLRIAQILQPDLILLDLVMPVMDGARTCEALRMNESTRHIKIIVISGTPDQDRKVSAFLNGADDMIGKPYEVRELRARIRSKIRRIEERNEKSSQTVKFGNLTLSPDKFEVRIDEAAISISVLEFNLLRFFLENADRVVTRQKILDAVWRDSVVSDRTVDTHMASLRKKLVGFNREFKTIYSAGYILKSESSNPRGRQVRRIHSTKAHPIS